MKNRYGRTIAAVLIFSLVAIPVFLCIMQPSWAEPPDTYHTGWNLVRASGDEDSTTFADEYDLTGVTAGISGAFEDMNDSRFRIPSRDPDQGVGYSHGTKWAFVICGKLYEDVGGTFSYSLVGWSKDNGMLQTICEGTGALGDQTVVKYPGGDDALGELVSLTAVAYTHSTETFTSTDNFDDVTVGMMARVTGTGFTDEIVDITTVTNNDSVVCDITTSTADCTDATIQINPSFWADTIVVTALTKWSAAGTANANTDTMANNIAVLNSADNEVAVLVVDLAGLEYVQFVLFDCDAANSEEAGALRVYGRPY